jgi:hypothetical protein
VTFHGQHVNISENIDRILRREIESFLNSAVRAIKDGLQAVLAGLEQKIGFLFQQQQAFDKAIEKLRLTNPVLAAYLQATRAHWSERLVITRNELHGTWVLPRTSYNVDEENRVATMVEPEVKGLAVTTFVSQMLDRVCCFVEEVVTFALSKQLPQFIWVTQIPIANRKPALPHRFVLALRGGGSTEWQLTVTTSPFDET